MELKGKRVFITGAGRGIGRALAQEFARAGCRLALCDLDQEVLEATAREISALGAEVQSFPLDVTDPASVAALPDLLGEIDVLVNNAGVAFGGPFLEVPMAKHALTYRVNVEGLVAVTYALLPGMLRRPAAAIVNLASASGYLGLPRGSSYASSKWAVLGFAESLRLELAEQGLRQVRITNVCPSYVGTGLFEGVKAVRTTRILAPESVARAAVAAVRSGRLWVRMPWLVHLTPIVRALLPTRLSDAVLRWFGVTTSMRGWKGRSG